MTRGIRTEAHVTVYCDTCGDPFTDPAGQRYCFTSLGAAVAYVTGADAEGWDYDGDRVTCDGCQRAADCATEGHMFAEPSIFTRLLAPAPRCCTCCGIHENELTP